MTQISAATEFAIHYSNGLEVRVDTYPEAIALLRAVDYASDDGARAYATFAGSSLWYPVVLRAGEHRPSCAEVRP